ncbi:5-formyltetrahydrofolate cyclo-ligase [Treponema parvum]|uniref:5-formyltetrahydrofolate cyclo-ligase n=1 Tax=Treponema parvum TaxID=138851 RepID=A0A975ICY9_9SPIR|nr:5-formyltetrahydrofolate cyclo-ligase [Treponema parvum]QTQ12297.1 5-formyltetrahydrofolate cyclo-ligase [Treponema parvum]
MCKSILTHDIDVQKKLLRGQMQKTLKDLLNDDSKVREAAKRAAEFFLNWKFYKEADILMAFVSSKEEINTLRILHEALSDKKKVAVPRVISDTRMDFFYLERDKPFEYQLSPGIFGILEPTELLKRFEVSDAAGKKTTMLVPGLAFSKDGHRIGRGKGFYDGFFSRFLPPVRCGFCFDVQIIPEVPHDNFDANVSHIISESGIIDCADRGRDSEP